MLRYPPCQAIEDQNMDFPITQDTILTANSRLALHLQTQFDEQQRLLGKTTWETPCILPLTRWLEMTFYQHNTEGLLLLTEFQHLCLWEEIISHSPETESLLQPREMARLAKEAHERLLLWQVPTNNLADFQAQPEIAHLIHWITLFEKKLQTHRWIISAQLPNHLFEKKITLNGNTVLVGFDDLSPALAKLCHAATHIASPERDNHITRLALQDTDHEIHTMAHWAKRCLSENPNAKIGCIVPSLSNHRHKIARIFTEVFCIEHILPGVEAQPLPFNISAGYPLSDHPMIQTALSLLQWLKKPLLIDEIAPILQSPYLWDNESQKNHGAMIDAHLRKKNFLTVSFKTIVEHIPAWQPLEQKTGTKLLPSGWKDYFIDLLKLVHWPASRTQTSLEYQILERFKKLLQEFSALDTIFTQISYTKALSLLSTLCRDTLFQAQSHHEPIQIMGVLEASHIYFDAAWVMGLDDTTWPAAAKPHPLIPYAIQQQFNMPHATAKRELLFCEQMTHRLKNTANTVIFSSPKQEGDQHRATSALITDIPIIDNIIDDTHPSFAETQQQTAILETLLDEKATVLAHTSTLRGGAEILELQALCPFRAFTTIRLQARPLNTPKLGIPAHIQGSLVHQILFYVWVYLKDQKALLSLSETDLTQLILESIEKSRLDLALPNHYFMDVEKKRLLILIQDWLSFEKTRPDFRVVACETESMLTTQQLPIRVRQDRVDILADGTQLLIDYKTRTQSVTGWFQERLHNAQLPLYATFHPDKYQGICFAEITPLKMHMKGVAHEHYTHHDLTPINRLKQNVHGFDWASLMTYWKQSLEKLSQDFYEGVATVDPLKPAVCQTCQLQAVCRYRNCHD